MAEAATMKHEHDGTLRISSTVGENTKIEHNGDIIIEGDVAKNTEITSFNGKVIIEGQTGSDVTVTAKGDISIVKGAGGNTKIKSQEGNVDLGYAEKKCVVEAPQGSVEVKTYVNVGSEITAKNDIKIGVKLASNTKLTSEEGSVDIGEDVNEDVFINAPQGSVKVEGTVHARSEITTKSNIHVGGNLSNDVKLTSKEGSVTVKGRIAKGCEIIQSGQPSQTARLAANQNSEQQAQGTSRT